MKTSRQEERTVSYCRSVNATCSSIKVSFDISCLHPEFLQVIFHALKVVEPFFDVLLMLKLFIEDGGDHLVRGEVLAIGEAGDLLVTLDGASFSLEVLFQDDLHVWICGCVILAPAQLEPVFRMQDRRSSQLYDASDDEHGVIQFLRGMQEQFRLDLAPHGALHHPAADPVLVICQPLL